ncbi:MAG: RimK family alpha-L-glutamate ligase [Myxococcota bacterium]|nr:RimK family alpha-L-glutamate ligase [Myxococcota bacterium]
MKPSASTAIGLTVLTRSDTFYTSRRLLEAARDRHLTVSWVDASATAEDALTQLRGGPRGRLPELVLPRIGSRCTSKELTILRALVDAGIFSPSSPAGLLAAMDKAETDARLRAAGLPVVPGRLVTSCQEVLTTAEAMGGGAMVLKPRFGSQGRDVLLARTTAALTAAAQAVLERNGEAIIQPLVSMDPARDLRVLVVGGVATAGCWRIAATNEFRSNVHLGAETRSAALDDEVAGLACAAAQAVGLTYAGVDLLPTPSGYQILEVNGSPGLEGIEGATGRDLATEVIDWAVAALEVSTSSSPGGPRSERSRSPSPPISHP